MILTNKLKSLPEEWIGSSTSCNGQLYRSIKQDLTLYPAQNSTHTISHDYLRLRTFNRRNLTLSNCLKSLASK